MAESSRALERLQEELEKKAHAVYCYKCGRDVKPKVKLYPTLLGEIRVEYVCPYHGIVLLTETIEKMRLPDRKPYLVVGGAYIAFEGIDGAGKTYYAKWIVSELRKKGYDVIYVIEPYVKAIKEFLYKYDIDADAEVFIFAADRIILQKTIVLPALKQNKIVISDRSIYSSIVYQSIRGVSEEYIWGINRSIKVPEFVVILDLPVREALDRLRRTRDKLTKFEEEGFLLRARKKFLELPKKYSHISKFVIISTALPEEDVKKEILERVLEYLRTKGESGR